MATEEPIGHQKIGRLALRHEGNRVNAYYAMPKTMIDGLLLFSVDARAAGYPSVHERILDLGRQIVGEIVFEATGIRPVWGGPQPAPEHERSGHG